MSPTPAERQLILISAGVAQRRQTLAPRMRELGEHIDWSQLAATLHARKLLPLLGPRLLDVASDTAGDDFAAAVARSLEVGGRQGAFLVLITQRIVAMLADAGVRCSPLKGPQLGERIYGDVGRRLSSDIDLLVAPEQLNAAVEVVRELGYGPPLDPVEDDGLPLLHFALIHDREELPPVELHWRVHWHERRFARERLLAPEPDRDGRWRPAPVDELVELLLFYVRDGFIDLRAATDLGAWWDTFGEQVAPEAISELLGVYPEFARLLPATLAVSERIVGLPAARRMLSDGPSLGPRARMAVLLANPNPRGGQAQLYAEKGFVDGLLTPLGELGAFVRRELLPPREVRDLQARHAGREWTRSRLARCVGVLGRYGLTMTRLLRAPETLT